VDLIQRVASPRVFENRFCQGLSSSGSPDIEHALHVAHAVKALIQADDAGDVIRVGSTFEEASPHGGIVRSSFFKLEPGALETPRHHDRLPVAAEIGLGLGLGEAQQMEHRFLLILRPQALAFDVGSTRSEDVYADNGKPDQHGDDRQEWGHDQEHAFAHREPSNDFLEESHKSSAVNVLHSRLSVLPEPLRYRNKLALAFVSKPNLRLLDSTLRACGRNKRNVGKPVKITAGC